MPNEAEGSPDFTIVLTGYDRAQVDAYLRQIRQVRHPAGPPPKFDRALRGYEITQVDAYVRQLLAGDGDGGAMPAVAPRFTIVLRGYDRREVERFVADAQRRIAELEATVAELRSEPREAGSA